MSDDQKPITREKLIQQLTSVAKRLQRRPTRRDLDDAVKRGECAPQSSFDRQFGSFGEALRSAGLKKS